jgi:hypothetical protein
MALEALPVAMGACESVMGRRPPPQASPQLDVSIDPDSLVEYQDTHGRRALHAVAGIRPARAPRSHHHHHHHHQRRRRRGARSCEP